MPLSPHHNLVVQLSLSFHEIVTTFFAECSGLMGAADIVIPKEQEKTLNINIITGNEGKELCNCFKIIQRITPKVRI